LIKALDKFSQALELLNDKSDKGTGLPNSGSGWPVFSFFHFFTNNPTKKIVLP